MLVVSLGRRSAYGGVVHELDARELRSARSSRSTSRSSARSLGLAVARPRVLCLLVAYPVAYWLGLRAPERWRNALLVLVDPALLDELPRPHVRLDRPAAHRGRREPRPRARSACRPRPLLYNDFAVLLGQVYGELPFMIIPLYVSLEKLDRSLLEAAADLGATPARALLAGHRCR